MSFPRSPLSKMFESRLCSRVLATSTWLLLCAPIAWITADAISFQHFSTHLAQIQQNNVSRLQELRSQVSDTLKRLNGVSEMNSDQPECTTEVFRQQAQLIRQWRYVNEAAVRLGSGPVCHSFGVQQNAGALPNNQDANYYATGDGRFYWFNAGPDVSADAGNVVIAQGNSYLWLNKGILMDVMSLPADLSMDLVDDKSLQSVFSNNVATIHLLKHPALGELSIAQDRIYVAYPVKWAGAFALVSLPISAYHQIWLLVFSGLMVANLILVFTFYLAARIAYKRKFSTLAKFRKALKRNQLKLHYQPIVEMQTGRWKGAEALLRWTNDGKPVTPHVFIPLAESSGMIRDLTRWVCKQVAEDHATYLWACKDLYITINLSAADVTDASFPDFVEALFKTHGIPASRIIFEVTESSLIDKDLACTQLERLRNLGHRIAVDDFGTGYSNLSFLEKLPVDILKIDRSFLNAEKIVSTDSVVWHVTRLAHSLNLTVVAEGLETIEQVEAVMIAGVPLAQGWFYSRALPIEQLVKGFFAVTIAPVERTVI